MLMAPGTAFKLISPFGSNIILSMLPDFIHTLIKNKLKNNDSLVYFSLCNYQMQFHSM